VIMMPTPSTPLVRIYLFTYRRTDTLERALNSLLAQTETNWVCELHNDDPLDSYPEQLFEKYADRRITYRCHDRNLGPVASFNLAFQRVNEPFVSILEDDNWWEADFLSTMLAVMDQHPHVNVAWANMWFAREANDGKWHRNGTIWPHPVPKCLDEFAPPDPRQVCGCLHSNGAMLVRVSRATAFDVPRSLPFFAIEAVRERAYPGHLLLVNRPLANFAITQTSARGESADENMQILVLLAESFLKYANVDRKFYRQMWFACRGSLGHKHRALLVAAILAGRLGDVLKGASLADLALVAAWAAKHPLRFLKLFQASKRFPEVSAFLHSATRSRISEWMLNDKSAACEAN
jgi:glycosyltransferase involved in cell wall biosynthesis